MHESFQFPVGKRTSSLIKPLYLKKKKKRSFLINQQRLLSIFCSAAVGRMFLLAQTGGGREPCGPGS